jgi:hypothetical protein
MAELVIKLARLDLLFLGSVKTYHISGAWYFELKMPVGIF